MLTIKSISTNIKTKSRKNTISSESVRVKQQIIVKKEKEKDRIREFELCKEVYIRGTLPNVPQKTSAHVYVPK